MTGPLRRLGGWLDDRLNPIVVKELRQAVQGRFVSAVLNLLLLVQVTVLTFFLLNSNIKSVNVASGNGEGAPAFAAIFGFLLFTTMVVLPFYAAVRLSVERSGDGLSLLFISTLPPWRIISGKLLANQALVALLFIACLPFVSFTYFLRGIDLPSILVVFTAGFAVAGVCLQGTILLACLPGSRFVKVLLGLGSLVLLFITFSMSMNLFSMLLARGIGSRLGRGDFWISAGTFLGIAGFVLGLFFLLSVALVSPPMANRAFPLRIYLAATWLVSAAVVAVRTPRLQDPDLVEAWLVTWIAIAAVALVVAVSARDRMSARVAREVPGSTFKRALAFVFWSGSGSGLVWALGMIVLSLAAAVFFDSLLISRSVSGIYEMAGFSGYCLAYAMTAMLLQRRYLSRHVPTGLTWALAVGLVLLGSILPLVFGFLLAPEAFASSREDWAFNFLNPGAPFNRHTKYPAFRFALVWSGVVGVLASRWFLRQVRVFEKPR